MKPRKPKAEESPTKLAKEYYRKNSDSKNTKSFVPIGPKFVITQPSLVQVKVESNK